MVRLLGLSCLGVIALSACSEYDVKPSPATVDVPPPTPPVPTPPPTPPPTPVPDPVFPDIQVDPPSLDFGTWPAGCPANPAVVTITNVGGADLDVSSLSNATAEFVVGANPFTLAPAETLSVFVDFVAPTATSYADGITILSNDPDEPSVVIPLAGAGTDSGLITETYTQIGTSQPVDILWIIDNSESMIDNVNQLSNSFGGFIQGFLALGLDFQIGVITTDMEDPTHSGNLRGPIIDQFTPDPVGQFQANAAVGTGGSFDEQGLDASYAALTSPLIGGANAGLVRPGSLLSIIVVTDEGDSSTVAPGVDISPSNYISWLDAYQGDPALTNFSVVGGPTTGLFPCGGFLGASPVPRYWEVASNTGGIHLNICNLDMSLIVQALAIVAAGLETEFPLAGVPADPNSIEITVDGQLVPNDPVNGWLYDGATNTVQFTGFGIPLAGSDVVVTYGAPITCP